MNDFVAWFMEAIWENYALVSIRDQESKSITRLHLEDMMLVCC